MLTRQMLNHVLQQVGKACLLYTLISTRDEALQRSRTRAYDPTAQKHGGNWKVDSCNGACFHCIVIALEQSGEPPSQTNWAGQHVLRATFPY
jgi:hypothetical protein